MFLHFLGNNSKSERCWQDVSRELWAYAAVVTFIVCSEVTVQMEERVAVYNGERIDRGSRTSSEITVTPEGCRASAWRNGQCVLAVPASSKFPPSFDLTHCRTLLANEGFQIPKEDFEIPLETALHAPFVRRYLLFNSSLFHFIMAPIMYMVLWCAVYSSLHQYLENVTEFWVLCLSVGLVTVAITTSILLILNYRKKEININADIRLVQVNERLVRYGLLLGVADWVQQFSWKIQLFCMFWDLSPCLQSLTETLEELGFVRDEIPNKLKKRMSHLVLVAEVTTLEPEAGSQSEDADEQSPLLGEGSSLRQPEKDKLTRNYSLIPDCTLSYQAIAYQLLMTYSAAYVRLVVLERLPGSSHRPVGPERTHCTTAPLCLCQYVQHKVLH